MRARAAAGGAVPGRLGPNLLSRSRVRRPAPHAVRSGDHGPRRRARSDLHGRGARSVRRDRPARSRGDGRRGRGGADSAAGGKSTAPPIPTSSRTTTCTASICRSSIAARGGSASRSRSGRIGSGLRQRAARRGIESEGDGDARRRVRFVAPGRELIDTLDAVLRHDFSTRALPDHGLKAVARHLGIAGPDREHIPGDRIYEVYRRDPARVRRYAAADVEEVAGARADARRRRVRARADGAATLRAARRCRRGNRRDRSAARPRVPACRDGAARASAGRRNSAQRRGAAPVRVPASRSAWSRPTSPACTRR